jgi:hypothetical protein
MPELHTLTREELLDRYRPRNLRRDRDGNAILYDCTVPADGSPGRADPVIRWQVLTRRLCGLCGDLLGDEVALIGTPGQAVRRRFSIPAMHVDCARYAFAAIPLFAEVGIVRGPTGFARSRNLALYICPGYSVSRRALLRLRFVPPGRLDTIRLIDAEPPTAVEHHTGWRSMAALVAADGCPPHADAGITGCREHAELLSPTERARVMQRGDAASDLPAPETNPAGTNMRDLFAPRNLRVEANGFPLTFENAVKPDGTAEPRTDNRIERRSLHKKRCLVCGDDLGAEVAFIGTTRAAESGWFPTTGMHVDCARLAFAVCPFIARRDWTPDNHYPQHLRTPEMVLVIAESYRYAPWRWWLALKLASPYRRANFPGPAKVSHVLREERHGDRRAMATYLSEHGGCPAHREQGLTGCPAHAGTGREELWADGAAVVDTRRASGG